MTIDDSVFDGILDGSVGMSLTGLWVNTEYVPDWIVPVVYQGFAGHVQLFFYCLRRMLLERRLLLQKNGIILSGSVDDQINLFKAVFPASEDDVNLGGGGVWFYSEECPGEAVWVMIDGDGEEWLDWA